MNPLSIEQAIEVFARGFSFTRSFTYPYPAEQIHERVWVMRDSPRTRGEYRAEEYVGQGVEPAVLDAFARQHTRGHYRICAIRVLEESDAPLRTGFKSLGYRLMSTEAFMVHSLEQIPDAESAWPVVRVTTPEAAETLAKAAGRRQILPEHLGADPAPMRQYVALEQETPIGWVGSVVAAGCCWCTSMFVQPACRRRGIATALLTRMLHDDRAAGARANVLLASHAGSKLYPTVGYEPVGELLLFVPRSRRPEPSSRT